MSKDKSWWAMFRSMKMGLYLVLAIIIASIVGTIVPQQQLNGPEGWLKTFFHLNDLYHSWWYITLLTLLTLNLVACSFYRLKTIRLSMGRSKRLLDKEQLTRLKDHKSFTFTGQIDEAKIRIISILTRRGYEVWSNSLEGSCRIGAQHGRFAAWGSIITHFSFVVIMAGFLIGAVCGYRGSINAPVGTIFSVSSIPGIDAKLLKNDFQVRVEGFWIERYPNGTPSGYFSRLTVLENNELMQTTTIGVNSPFNYKGTKFYQARYGDAIEIQVNGPDARTIYQGFVLEGENLKIPGTNFGILPRLDYSKTASSKSEPTDANSLRIIYVLFESNQRVGMGAAEIGAAINLGPEANTIKFIRSVPYTGLQVKKDPGVPLIWFGSVFMLLGMGVSFFLQQRHVWMVLEQQGKLLAVRISGQANKNSMLLTDHIKNIVNDIQAGATLLHPESTNTKGGQENG